MFELDFSKSEQYTLSIRLSADGFSFYIHHPSRKDERVFIPYQVNPSYSMTANIKEMLDSTEALKHPYKKVNILIETSRFTFIPFDLYEDEQTETFFYHNFARINNEVVLCNILAQNNIVLLFGMDKHAYQLLCETFPSARFFACTSPVIEHLATQSKKESNRELYAHPQKTRTDIYAFHKGKLLLTNTFNSKHFGDQVYYLLYTWQQLGYNQTKDQLWLINTPTNQDELLTELRKFLRKVSILPISESNIPFDIQTLLTCE